MPQKDAIRQILDSYAVFTDHGRVRRYSKRSLCCLSQTSGIRRAAAWLITWPWFDRFILLTILANSAILGIADWSNVDSNGRFLTDNSFRNAVMQGSEPIFTAIFVVEAALKIVAMGFVMSPGSYLRIGWNVLDFSIVALALLASVPSMPNYTVVRVMRVLRPLRSLTAIPSLRGVIQAMLRALPMLGNIVVLLVFIFGIFGVFTLQLYQGTMHGRCRLTALPVRMAGASSMVDGSGIGMCADSNSLACFYSIANLSSVTTPSIANSVYYSSSAGMQMNSWVDDTKVTSCIPGQMDVDEWPPVGSSLQPPTQSSSSDDGPWANPRDCFWPLDPFDQRLCTLTDWGGRPCGPGRWCGSNYDAHGSPRFTNEQVRR